MLARPWPIKILFLCHVLAPFINVFFSAWMSGSSIDDFLQVKWERASLIELFAMFALLPMGGIVIFLCKKWSYYLYFSVMLGVFYFNYVKWQEYPHLFDLTYVILFFAVNLFVVGYFLVPAVRSVYFNDRLRWWESKPRYLVGLKGEILIPEGSLDCEIENISQGGARIRLQGNTLDRTEITVRFNYEGQVFAVNSEVRHSEGGVLGVEFLHSGETKSQIRQMIRKSFAKKFTDRNATPPILESFFDWIHTLLKTGKGLVPASVSEPARRKKLKKTVNKSKRKEKTTKKIT